MLKRTLQKVLKRKMHPFESVHFAKIYNLPIKEALISIDNLESSPEKLAILGMKISKTMMNREDAPYLENYLKKESGEILFSDLIKKINYLDLRGVLDLVSIFNFRLNEENLQEILIRVSDFLKQDNDNDLSLKLKLLRIFEERDETVQQGTIKKYFLPQTIEDFYLKNELDMNVNDKILILGYFVKLLPDKEIFINNILEDIFENRGYIKGLSFLSLLKNTFELLFNKLVKKRKFDQNEFLLSYFKKLDSLPIVLDIQTNFHPILFLRTISIYNSLPVNSEKFIKSFFSDNLNKVALKQNIYYNFEIYIDFLERMLMKHPDQSQPMIEIHIKNLKSEILKSNFHCKLLACNIFSVFANNDHISYQDPIFSELKENLNLSIDSGELLKLVQNYQFSLITLLNIGKINLDFKPVIDRAVEMLKMNIPMVEQFMKEMEQQQKNNL